MAARARAVLPLCEGYDAAFIEAARVFAVSLTAHPHLEERVLELTDRTNTTILNVYTFAVCPLIVFRSPVERNNVNLGSVGVVPDNAQSRGPDPEPAVPRGALAVVL